MPLSASPIRGTPVPRRHPDIPLSGGEGAAERADCQDMNAAKRFLPLVLCLVLCALLAGTLFVGEAAARKNRAPATASLTVASATTTAISVSWQPMTVSSKGLASAYAIFVGRKYVATTWLTNHTVTGLRCGQGYVITVVGFVDAESSSFRSRMRAQRVFAGTAPCLSAADTRAPSAPIGLGQTAAEMSSVAVSWKASEDDVGVTGYAVYVNGAQSGSTSALQYVAQGLTCGSSVTVEVEALDQAGNRSPKIGRAHV